MVTVRLTVFCCRMILALKLCPTLAPSTMACASAADLTGLPPVRHTVPQVSSAPRGGARRVGSALRVGLVVTELRDQVHGVWAVHCDLCPVHCDLTELRDQVELAEACLGGGRLGRHREHERALHLREGVRRWWKVVEGGRRCEKERALDLRGARWPIGSGLRFGFGLGGSGSVQGQGQG